MRAPVTRERLQDLMEEIAATAPAGRHYEVYLVGGGTAVYQGWRASSVDADLCAEDEAEVFRDIQGIKERLEMNIEFARPEHFVPPLAGSADRHVFIQKIREVSFFHYDPYAQVLSKVVRGFERDMEDAARFVQSGLVDRDRLLELVGEIPSGVYAKYPNLTSSAVREAVVNFLEHAHPG